MKTERERVGRKLLLMAAVLTGFFCMSAMQVNAGESKTLRIGYMEIPHFTEGAGDNQVKSGYGYEYLQKVAYYTGWNYEYVYDDWASCLEKLKCGEVDMVAGVSYTPERALQLYYPGYSMGTEGDYIYVPQDSELVNKGEDGLSGATIGCMRDSMQKLHLEQWRREHHVTCTIREYDGNDEMYEALRQKHIEAIVNTDIAVTSADGMVPVNNVGSSDFYLAVSNKAPDLLEELNNALEELEREDPYFRHNLYNQYLSETLVGVVLSQTELDWLETHDRIRVGYMDDYMPFSNTDDEGNAQGLIADLFQAVFAKLSIEKVPEVTFCGFRDQNRLLESLKEGEIDVIFPIYGNAWLSEREGVFQTADIMEIPIDLVCAENYSDLTVERIGVNRNNIIQYQYSVAQYPDAEIVYYDSILDCLDAVLEGSIDCTFMNGLRTDAYAYKDYYKKLQVYHVPQAFRMAMGVHKGDIGLLELLNRGLNTLDSNYALLTAYQYQQQMDTYTIKDFLWEHIWSVILAGVLVIGFILFFVFREAIRSRHYLEKEKELAKELEKALKAEQSANKAKTDFLNAVSHDIRTPMNAILGFADLMEKELDQRDKLKDHLHKMQLSGNSLMFIINNVLELSCLESGREELNERLINLKEDEFQILPLFEKQVEEKKLNLSFHRDIEHYRFYGDLSKIRNITINLVSNAIKYTPEGGTIDVHMQEFKSPRPGYATFVQTVTDTGIGMSGEFLNRIYESFEREHNTTESKIPGMGLGMSIVKRYVDLMGGKIDITSELGKGSCFKVTLELRLAEEDTRLHKEKQQYDFRGTRILLAEDNDLNAEIAMAILEDTGAQIDRVADGAACVERIREKAAGSYDLILMDVQMPVMNGYEATECIRKLEDPEKANIPIVALTANAFREDKRKALDIGMDEHVAKPLDVDVLKQVISRLSKGRKL